jgi:uncharacterized protein
MTAAKKDINCPTCKKPETWRENNLFKPFCSERCKLIDLGAWADEDHRIAGEEAPPEEDQ